MKVRFTPRAFRELQAIFDHIDQHSPLGARNVKARIQAMIGIISAQPRAGVLIGSRRLRKIVALPYPCLIFYRATSDEIVIHGVRHGARRPSSMPR